MIKYNEKFEFAEIDINDKICKIKLFNKLHNDSTSVTYLYNVKAKNAYIRAVNNNMINYEYADLYDYYKAPSIYKINAFNYLKKQARFINAHTFGVTSANASIFTTITTVQLRIDNKNYILILYDTAQHAYFYIF